MVDCHLRQLPLQVAFYNMQRLITTGKRSCFGCQDSLVVRILCIDPPIGGLNPL